VARDDRSLFHARRFHGGIIRAEKVVPLFSVDELVRTLRLQAMIRGYRYVTRVWVSVGSDTAVPKDQLRHALEQELTGELFETCQITIEAEEGAEIKLDRMEGILVLPKCSS